MLAIACIEPSKQIRATLAAMETKRLADWIGTHPDTIRRWTKKYAPFLSNSATPKKGSSRVYTRHDAAVMQFIGAQRDAGLDLDDIYKRLVELRDQQWENLPAAPDVWFEQERDDAISLKVASERASELAQVAVLQNELTHTREMLQEAQQREFQLQHDLENLQASERASSGEIADLKLQLAQEQGNVAALKAQLQQYALGGNQPLPVGAIIVRVALVMVVIVLCVFVVARLLL